MGTRSIIAYPVSEDEGLPKWRGIYCHWDGYPSGNGKRLYQLANECFGGDGLALAQYLVTNFPEGISGLDADGSPAESGWSFSALPGGKHLVLAYRGRGETEPDIRTNEHPDWEEWFYLLTKDGMSIYSTDYHSGPSPRAHIVLFGQPEPDWDALDRHGHYE